MIASKLFFVVIAAGVVLVMMFGIYIIKPTGTNTSAQTAEPVPTVCFYDAGTMELNCR